MKLGQHLNVWITDCGTVAFRAEVTAIRYDGLPVALQVLAEDGRRSYQRLRLGQFVVLHDQTPPEWDRSTPEV